MHKPYSRVTWASMYVYGPAEIRHLWFQSSFSTPKIALEPNKYGLVHWDPAFFRLSGYFISRALFERSQSKLWGILLQRHIKLLGVCWLTGINGYRYTNTTLEAYFVDEMYQISFNTCSWLKLSHSHKRYVLRKSCHFNPAFYGILLILHGRSFCSDDQILQEAKRVKDYQLRPAWAWHTVWHPG